jgi:AAA15 family ATPase/GTPase
MFPNIKREKFSRHIYTDMAVPVLKQAAIYGANGSGKSNFINAIDFIRGFLTQDNFLKRVNLDDYIFQLTKEKSQTLSFEIEFFHKDRYYIYNVGIDEKRVSEKLSISGIGRAEDKMIFDRNGTTIESDYLQNKNTVEQMLQLNPFVSLLPLNKRFPIINNTDINNVHDWFLNKLVIVSIKSTIPVLIGLMSNKPRLLSFANTVFENIGIGISSLKVKNTSFEKWVADKKNADTLKELVENNSQQQNINISQMVNDRNAFNISIQKGIRTVQEFMFYQTGQGSYHTEMKISAQSDGTVRLLTLIPALYDAMYEQKTVCIDEIDNSIHPNLMFELLRFYADNEHEPNGQLIFTTHTTKLLNQQELVRPDEIWLTEKSEGSTKMYSLNDFKLHNTLNIENGYLDGRYGAVPVIDELSVKV